VILLLKTTVMASASIRQARGIIHCRQSRADARSSLTDVVSMCFTRQSAGRARTYVDSP
jgi:hypothetical protein